jgi:hypothetical protein
MLMNIQPYSDRSFVVRGEDTKNYTQDLKNLGGKWNRSLKSTEGEISAGWIFSNKRLESVKALIDDVAPLVPAKQPKRKLLGSRSPPAKKRTNPADAPTDAPAKKRTKHAPVAPAKSYKCACSVTLNTLFLVWFAVMVCIFAALNVSPKEKFLEEYNSLISNQDEPFMSNFTSNFTQLYCIWGTSCDWEV